MNSIYELQVHHVTLDYGFLQTRSYVKLLGKRWISPILDFTNSWLGKFWARILDRGCTLHIPAYAGEFSGCNWKWHFYCTCYIKHYAIVSWGYAELDKRKTPKVKFTIKWVISDDFWHSNSMEFCLTNIWISMFGYISKVPWISFSLDGRT